MSENVYPVSFHEGLVGSPCFKPSPDSHVWKLARLDAVPAQKVEPFLQGIVLNGQRFIAQSEPLRSKKLLVTSASLLVTSALLVVTRTQRSNDAQVLRCNLGGVEGVKGRFP